MHHPDIHDILAIVTDYWTLSNRDLKFKIEPTIYTKPVTHYKPDEDIRERPGLKVIHQLQQGRLEINIFGYLEDYDCMDVQYFGYEDPTQLVENVPTFNYCEYSVRAAIRKIMILDRDRKIEAESK